MDAETRRRQKNKSSLVSRINLYYYYANIAEIWPYTHVYVDIPARDEADEDDDDDEGRHCWSECWLLHNGHTKEKLETLIYYISLKGEHRATKVTDEDDNLLRLFIRQIFIQQLQGASDEDLKTVFNSISDEWL